MPHTAAQLLAELQMKTAGRPRYQPHPDREKAVWITRPGEAKDHGIANVATQCQILQAAEAALQTDALVTIAAALTAIADAPTKEERWPCSS